MQARGMLSACFLFSTPWAINFKPWECPHVIPPKYSNHSKLKINSTIMGFVCWEWDTCSVENKPVLWYRIILYYTKDTESLIILTWTIWLITWTAVSQTSRAPSFFVLNSTFRHVGIQFAILDVLIDFLGCFQKCLFHIFTTEMTGEEKSEVKIVLVHAKLFTDKILITDLRRNSIRSNKLFCIYFFY